MELADTNFVIKVDETMISTAQMDRDVNKRDISITKLESTTAVNPTSSTKMWWFICLIGLISDGYQIYSGVLTLIQLFSAGFSLLLLIYAVHQIGSGIKSSVRVFTRLLSSRSKREGDNAL